MYDLLPLTLYTADSPLRAPRTFFRAMGRDLWAARELAWRLFVRNLRAQYRQSLLGYVWAVLPPLFTTVTWVLLNRAGLVNVGAVGMPYPIYVLVGTLGWQLFVDALNSPLDQMQDASSLLTKVNFPREALILAGAGAVLFNLFIRVVLTLGVLLLFGVGLPLSIFLAPVGLLALLLLGLALGLLLVPLGMLYQDVPRGLTLVTTLWFFITPIAYAPPTKGLAARIVALNPVTPLIETTRAVSITGNVADPLAFILISAGALILFFVSWILFRLALPHMIARMSSR